MTTTVLRSLLKYPHSAVFDASPDGELAFRLRHPLGARWRIADRVFTAWAGADEWVFGLSGLTVDQLVEGLESAGFSVESRSARYNGYSALVLVEGDGDELESNGDHILAFNSIMWALFSGYAGEVLDAEYQIRQALLQMFIPTAEGEWLDLWGTLYGVPRHPGETDASLRVRIPDEAFRIRVNGLAIEKTIKSLTGRDVEIREPWKLMFRLDKSALSGADHLHDADFYTPHIIQPVAREAFDWAEVLKIIHRNRAAGVLVHSPLVEFATREVPAQGPAEYIARSARTDVRLMGTWPGGEAPLGVMRLDDNEFTINHPVMAYQLRTYSNAEGLQTLQHIGLPINIAYASIELSGCVPLGDENAILSRGQERYLFDPEPVLSDSLAPSGYDAIGEVRRVERITLSVLAAGVEFGEVEASNQRTNVYGGFASAYDGLNAWEGWWDARNWLGWRQVGSRRIDIPA